MHSSLGYLSPKQFEDRLAQQSAFFPSVSRSSLRGSLQLHPSVGQFCVNINRESHPRQSARGERNEYLRSVTFEKFRPNTLSSKEALIRELDEIRENGVVFSMQEYTPEIVGIGVPISSSTGFPIGSLNLAIPSVRYSAAVEARTQQILQDSADRLRRQYSPD